MHLSVCVWVCPSVCLRVRYERFTRIMILSVLKHTKRRVKFWFIKNYLSPLFKVQGLAGCRWVLFS